MALDDPSRWECDAVLADGGTIHVRPTRPTDADDLVAFHGQLSDKTVYLRFFSAMPKLPPAVLHHFTQPDDDAHVSLIATLGDEIVALAGYDRVPDSDQAEVAFVVADAHQGRGIGTLMLEHLAVIARTHGIRSFAADTLSHNRRMLQVFRDAGFGVERVTEAGVVRISFPIQLTEGAWGAVERREHQAEAASVARLLAPRSIAVIGAGRRRGSIGHEVFRNLKEGGFAGSLYPIHRSAPEILGEPAYASVLDVPGDIDLGVLVVPLAEIPEVVRQCAEKRVHGLVVISAGFAEVGPEGAEAERELVALARGHGMRVIGPNCMGIVNTGAQVRMNATFAPFAPPAGRLGFLSQSGALGIAILERVKDLGLGISTFVSVGNKSDISGNDLLQYWQEDSETDVILLYLESFGNPRKFARIARRVSRATPIVAVKSGRSASGSRAAASHTAALASPDTAVDALFEQAGVIRVDTLGQLFATAQLLCHQPLPAGRRVAIVGNSGGPGILAADACERAGLVVPELAESTQQQLAELLPAGAAVRNPVDLLAAASPEHYERALRAVLADPGFDAVIVIYTPPLVTRPEKIAAAIARASEDAGPKPVAAIFLATQGVPEGLRADADGSAAAASRRSIPSFAFPESAARALSRAAAYAEWRARPEGRAPELEGIDAERAHRAVGRAVAGGSGGAWLEAAAVSELLECYGIPHAPTRRVETAGAASSAAVELGFPVALKAASPELLHKTDVGGVRLGLRTRPQVAEAFSQMAAELGDAMGGAVVQRMVDAGVETIVGVVHQENFGPLVMFGLGGIATDLLGDRAYRILPLTDLDVRDLVRSLKSAPLLFGYRGSPPANVKALEELLLRVGRMAAEIPEIVELDLNPVIVSQEGAVAVDAKLRVAPYAPRPELAHRRLR
ncbi:MAG: GNAT family N-acetyltransferase [Deltaproteobacteria bacterium]|nr:GNAT family N-acetyltransferase [Deltaproteobacteria bacterium]